MRLKLIPLGLFLSVFIPCCVFAGSNDLIAFTHERAFLAGLDNSYLFTTEEMHFVYRLLIAVILGCCMGFSHSFRRSFVSTISLRTFGAVSLGSAAFSCITIHLYLISGSTTTQVLQNLSTITTGIGFLCAAVIFKQGVTVKGLSTAATLWASAAVGSACGCNMYGIALTTTLLIAILHRCEKKPKKASRKTKILDTLPD